MAIGHIATTRLVVANALLCCGRWAESSCCCIIFVAACRKRGQAPRLGELVVKGCRARVSPPPQKVPLSMGIWIRWFLGPRKYASQTACRSVKPFLHSTRLCLTHSQYCDTDHATCVLCQHQAASTRCVQAMRPKNTRHIYCILHVLLAINLSAVCLSLPDDVRA